MAKVEVAKTPKFPSIRPKSLVDECSVGDDFSVVDKNSVVDIKSVGYGNSWLDENSVVAEKKSSCRRKFSSIPKFG